MSMTENEAIKDIQFLARRYDDLQEVNMSVSQESLDMAIQALEKVQALEENKTYQIYREYLAIGTVDEFKALKEKNEPKKVAYQGEHEKCPSCGSFCVLGRYCSECGQKIDWGND
jgi:hypothetical protein